MGAIDPRGILGVAWGGSLLITTGVMVVKKATKEVASAFAGVGGLDF